MKFQCDSCQASYKIADEKVGTRGVKVRCKKCEYVIIVRPAHLEQAANSPAVDVERNVEAPVDETRGHVPSEPHAVQTEQEPIEDRLEAAGAGDEFDESTRLVDSGYDDLRAQMTDAVDAPTQAVKIKVDRDIVQAEATQVSTMPPSGPDTVVQDGIGAGLQTNVEDPHFSAPLNATDELLGPSTAPVEAPLLSDAGPEQPREISGMSPMASLPLDDDEDAAREQTDLVAPDNDISSGLDSQLEGAFENMFAGGDLPEHFDGGDDVAGEDSLGDSFPPFNDDDDDVPAPGELDAAAGDEEEAIWHVAINDEDHGPLLLSQVREHILSGDVDMNTLVWCTGMGDWEDACDVAEIANLFTALPMPSRQNFDVGAPIDDTPNLSVGGGAIMEDDVAWRPHGLTDVYAAANLAEAAGGATPVGAQAEPAPELLADDAEGSVAASEPGWSPGAASALKSLVNDELNRLEDHPPGQPVMGGLDASAPVFSEQPSSLDATPAAFANLGATPAAFPTHGGTNENDTLGGGALLNGPSSAFGAAGQSGSAAFGASGFTDAALQAMKPKRPVWLYAAAAVAGLLMIVLVGGVAKLAFFSDDDKPTQVAMNGDAPVGAEAARTGEVPPGETDEKGAVAEKTENEKPSTAPKEEVDEPPETAPPATTSKPIAAKPKSVKKSSPKRTKKSSSKPKRAKPVISAKPKRSRKSNTKCDPVLDFDCDESAPKASTTQSKLSKADVLSVLKKKKRQTSSCVRKAGSGKQIKVSWKVQRSGRPSSVRAVGANASSSAAACLVREVKKMRFPKYTSGGPVPITFPFKG